MTCLHSVYCLYCLIYSTFPSVFVNILLQVEANPVLVFSGSFNCKKGLQTFLVSTFCFPNSDHVTLPQRIASFKYLLIHVRTCGTIFERQKENSLKRITWSELGKRNLQAKKVYFNNSLALREITCLSQTASIRMKHCFYLCILSSLFVYGFAAFADLNDASHILFLSL